MAVGKNEGRNMFKFEFFTIGMMKAVIWLKVWPCIAGMKDDNCLSAWICIEGMKELMKGGLSVEICN